MGQAGEFGVEEGMRQGDGAMIWSEEEVEEGCKAFRDVNPDGSRVAAIMTRAVELAAARVGTMTAERLEMGLRATAEESEILSDEIREHISALGARNAVLERDVLDARKALAEMHGKEAWESLTARAERAESELASLKPLDDTNREDLGREVREEWCAWAREQSNPKPSWLVPWEGLSEPDKEVDRRIGDRLFRLGRVGLKPSGQVAEDIATLHSVVDLHRSDDVGQRTEGFAALSRLAAGARCTQQAEQERDKTRDHLRSEMEQRAAALVENDSLRARVKELGEGRATVPYVVQRVVGDPPGVVTIRFDAPVTWVSVDPSWETHRCTCTTPAGSPHSPDCPSFVLPSGG